VTIQIFTIFDHDSFCEVRNLGLSYIRNIKQQGEEKQYNKNKEIRKRKGRK
jgi:hypothetical protein